MSWIVLAIIGGGFGISDKDSLVQVLCFVVAGMLTLLAHEFGHALVGRKLGGGNAAITIAGMGGITRHEFAPSSRLNYFITVLAGPLASLLLGITGGAILGLQLGQLEIGIQLSLTMPVGTISPEAAQVLLNSSISPTLFKLYAVLFLICFWWSVFNLLPILPLDGGRLLATLLNNNRIVCIIGLILCGILALWSLISGSWFNFLIIGYLGWLNWQFYRAHS
ncbi:MAG: hypothetical protein IJB00_08030 [Akkermansia sp.]|nr:hypothetical protein [Akkermansia sp.]